MFSLSSVMYSVLVVGCSLALPGAAVDTNLQESTVFGMDDIRTLSVAVAARSILHSLSAVDSRQWLMLLAALALGLTGLSMVLLNERRPRVDGEPILKGSEDGGQVAIAQMAADMAIGEPAEAFGPREGRGTLLGSTLPTRIFYLDHERRYRVVNQAFTDWFGLPKHAIVGLHVRELVGDTAWEIIRPRLDRAYAGQLVDYETEIPYRHGGTRWIHAVYTPHRNEDGTVVGVAVLVSDNRSGPSKRCGRARSDISTSLTRSALQFSRKTGPGSGSC